MSLCSKPAFPRLLTESPQYWKLNHSRFYGFLTYRQFRIVTDIGEPQLIIRLRGLVGLTPNDGQCERRNDETN